MPPNKIENSFGLGLKIGFGTTLLLLCTLMAVGLYSVEQIDKHLASIVRHSVVKANLANTMQAALRERAISMHSLAVMDDAFEKDEEFLHFTRLGFQFLKANQALKQHPLNAAEKSVLENLNRITALTQPLVTAINEKALVAESAQERIEVSRLIYEDAISNQRKVAIELDHLVKLQEDAIREDTQRAHEAYKDAHQLFWGIGLAGAGLGFIVAFLAVKRNATS